MDKEIEPRLRDRVLVTIKKKETAYSGDSVQCQKTER